MYIYKLLLKIFVLFAFISPCLTNSGRKYDIEQEAYKLYGEDFQSVLLRFRKTPDYLKILNDKMHDLKVYIKEMSLQVLHYYNGKIAQKVNEQIGISTTSQSVEETTTTASPPKLLRRSPLRYYKRRGSSYPDARRQGQKEEYLKGVKRLDAYKFFNNALTVTERNSFRDTGFEFAGNLIHTIINNMGPVVESGKTTGVLFTAGDTEPTTSEHPHTHQVVRESTSGPVEELTEAAETYKLRMVEFLFDNDKPTVIRNSK